MLTKRHFIDSEYGQLHYRLAVPVAKEITENTPLICLHMSPKSGRIFARFMDAFATDRKVIAPDYPGYGESDPPPLSPQVSIQDYARVCLRLLNDLGIEKADILGYHTGSLVAAEMATQQPQRVGKLILIGAPVFTAQELDKITAHFSPVPLDHAGTRFSMMWERVVEHGNKCNDLPLLAESFAENLRGGEYYEWGHIAAFAYAPVFPERLKALTHSIKVINPDDDLHQVTLRIADYIKTDIYNQPQWGHGFLDFDTSNAVAEIRRLLA